MKRYKLEAKVENDTVNIEYEKEDFTDLEILAILKTQYEAHYKIYIEKLNNLLNNQNKN